MSSPGFLTKIRLRTQDEEQSEVCHHVLYIEHIVLERNIPNHDL